MCTSLTVTAVDGSVAVARTMEFPNLMQAKLSIVPRGTPGESLSPNGPGHTWTSTHGFVGMDGFGDPQKLSDGLRARTGTTASFDGCKPSPYGVCQIAATTSSSDTRHHRLARFSLVLQCGSYSCTGP